MKKSPAGLEPATLRLEVVRAVQLRHEDSKKKTKKMSTTGFEPATPKRLRLKLSALDQLGHVDSCEKPNQ